MDLWRKARGRTTLVYIASSLALLVAILTLGDEVWRHIDALESRVETLGPWAYVVFILVYIILSSVFFPDTILGIVAGTMFGFPQALATVIFGSVTAAVLQYGLSLRLLKPAINKVVQANSRLSAIQAAVLGQELRLQWLIRLTPLNRALISYMLGAAGVRLSRFVLACTAILPNLTLEVYFGYAGRHLASAGQPQHVGFLHDVIMIAGFVAAVIVMIVISRTARRAIEEATSLEAVCQ